MNVLVFLVLAIIALVARAAPPSAGDCALKCNDMRTEVLTMEMCREAKRTLPRPKVGDFCSTAMEQGFSDVCVALCMGQTPVARVAQTCRSAALEMPRPTVRKWCEHGYTVAYDKSMKALVQRFVEINAENEKKTAEQHTKDFLKRQKEKDMADAAAKKQAAADAAAGVVPPPVVVTEAEVPKKIVATLPITLNEDETYELNVVEGQNVEDAVVVFCREHVSSDVAACIRQLLPDVLERYSEHTEGGGLRGN